MATVATCGHCTAPYSVVSKCVLCTSCEISLHEYDYKGHNLAATLYHSGVGSHSIFILLAIVIVL